MSDRLDEIRKRWKHTTEGPWAWYSYGEKCYGFGVGQFADENDNLVGGEIVEGMTGEPVQIESVCEMENQAGGRNAPAIAAAPADIAWLIAEVERLRKWQDELESNREVAEQ